MKHAGFYHFHVDIAGRKNGRRAVAVAAYICGGRIRDSYDGLLHNYTYRDDVISTEVMLPHDAPREYRDVQTLLDALNAAERRRDSQMARVFEMSLPNELPLRERVELAKQFVREYIIPEGQCAIIGIHSGEQLTHRKPDSIEPVCVRQDNPHAHILVPFRALGKNGFQRTKLQSRARNGRTSLIALRKGWADLTNRSLERHGSDIRVSHESLAMQGIERIATPHMGASSMALEVRGIQTERGDQYRKVMERNKERERDLQRRARELDREWERTR